jgi:hypothetical protein
MPVWQFNNDPTDREFWGMILLQDFQNMAEIQKGLKSRGLAAVRFNPQQEMSLINFHRVLSEYMEVKE